MNPARAAATAGACLARIAAAALLAAAVATAAGAVTLAPGWQAAGDARARAALILGAAPLPAGPVKSVTARLAADAAPWHDRLTAWQARALAPAPPRPMVALLAAAVQRPKAGPGHATLPRPADPRAAAPGRLREVVLADASPIPLPAGVWLLASGLAGLAGLARRRRPGRAPPQARFARETPPATTPAAGLSPPGRGPVPAGIRASRRRARKTLCSGAPFPQASRRNDPDSAGIAGTGNG